MILSLNLKSTRRVKISVYVGVRVCLSDVCLQLMFMLSRLFHHLDEALIYRPAETLSCWHWLNVFLPASVSDFFPKKGNGKLSAAWGRGWLLVEVGEKRVWERGREGGCSHLEFLCGTFTRGQRHTLPLWIYWKEETGCKVMASRGGQWESCGDVSHHLEQVMFSFVFGGTHW